MRLQNLAEELAEVRLTLARLKRRERQLELLVDQGEAHMTAPRPGWPIQRANLAARHTH